MPPQRNEEDEESDYTLSPKYLRDQLAEIRVAIADLAEGVQEVKTQQRIWRATAASLGALFGAVSGFLGALLGLRR